MVKIGNILTAVNNGANSVTIPSHVIANNPQRALYVAVNIEENTAGNRPVTGITRDGQSFTKSGDIEGSVAGVTTERVELWYLLNPNTGTADIVVSLSGACDSLSAQSIDVYNVPQIAPEVYNEGTVAGTSSTVAVTTISGYALVLSVAGGNNTTAMTHGAGQTERWNIAGGSHRATGTTEEPITASANSQVEAQTGAVRIVHIVVGITGNHEINVNDTVTIIESATLDLLINTNVFDTIQIIEYVSIYLEINVSAYTDVAITEYVELEVAINISVFDDIPITEFLDAYLDVLNKDVNDAITVSDYQELFLDQLFASVSDDIQVIEDVQAYLDILFISVFDSSSVDEYASGTVDPLIIVADDLVLVAEDFQNYLEQLVVSASDDISIIENLDIYLDVLNIAVLDPFHAVVTEHIDIIDLVVEVGIVEESIYVNDYENTSIDALFILIYDDILVSEFTNLFLNELFIFNFDSVSLVEYTDQYIDVQVIQIFDSINISDYSDQYLDVLNIDRFDVATHQEFYFVPVLDVLNIQAYEDISVAEYSAHELDALFLSVEDLATASEEVTLYLNELFLNASEPFDVTITEHVQVTDLIIEVGIVDDTISIFEYIDISLTELVVQPYDDISISEEFYSEIILVLFSANDIAIAEFESLYLDYLYVDVSDTATIAEYYDVFIPELFISVDDIILIVEYVSLLDIVIELDVYENVSIAEYALVLDIVIELEVDESILLSQYLSMLLPTLIIQPDDSIVLVENISMVLPRLNISLFDGISIAEYALVFDLIIELFATDSASVMEYLITPAGIIVGGDDVGVTGALTSYAFVIEYTSFYMEINISASDDIAVAEYQNVFDQIIELGIVYDDLLISEFGYQYLTNLIINRYDIVIVLESIVTDLLINILIYDSILIQDEALLFDSTHIDEPRIFEVVPRQRVFTIYKESDYFATQYGTRGR